LGTFALNRTNLREGVIWITPADDDHKEVVQEMAADYVRMGCAEVKKMEAPQTNPNHGNNKRILVVGGGISGMTAAIEAAKTGYDVLLVEKTGSLGGMAAKLAKRVPFREPFSDPVDTGIAGLIKQIEADKHIKVILNSTISKTSGAPGQFSVDISTESGSTATENVGGIIMASGFTPYDANKLPHLGFGKSKDVVDQVGLELLAKARTVPRSSARPMAKRSRAWCSSSAPASVPTRKASCRTAPATAATPRSSRPCTSRTRTRISTRW